MRRIGVALSGGGHRAATWGLGTLLALADAKVNQDVVSIASVSGGSIANGVVGQRLDYRQADGAEFERETGPALRHIAWEGLFFFGPASNRYLAWFFTIAGVAVAAVVGLLAALIAVGRELDPSWWLLAGPVVGALAWVLWLRKAKLPGRWLLLVVLVGLASLSAFAFLGVWLTEGARGWDAVWRLLVAAAVAGAALALALRTFARRSEALDDALARVHFPGGDGPPTPLAELASRTSHHVFCATELQAGDHIYFTPRLVYSYRVGMGTPGPLRLSTAVQASSCIPGGMVPREIDTAMFGLSRPWRVQDDEPPAVPDRIVVNDGGVYDNMADQWEQGFEDRTERIPHLGEIQEPATHLVVANAGKGLGWGHMGPTGPLSREVRALGRTISIVYDVTTSHRRQGLVRRFRDSSAQGRGMEGVLVHIAQSPFDLPRAFGKSPDPEQRARAASALQFLTEIGADDQAWERRASANAAVATVLRGLGSATVDLLEHAYLLTSVNAFVLFGWGALDEGARFARSRFERMCARDGEGT